MARSYARIGRYLVRLALLPALAAHGQTPSQPQAPRDWIDDFPSVTTVAHAAFEELKVTSHRSNIDTTGDEDAIAINLAGSYVVLRQLLFLKYNAETSMSPEREAKLGRLVAAYAQAELAIGEGAAGRRGYISRAAPTGMGCGGDSGCYRRWFELHLNASSARAEYRERLLKRLFPCSELAKELNDLRQRHATTIPFFPSPSVTLQLDRELVGLAPAGCAAMGGDANGNGLCDDWERASAASQVASAACGPKVRLGRIQQRNDTTVEVAFTRLNPADKGVPAIDLYRGSRNATQDELIPVTAVAVTKNPTPTGGPELAVLTTPKLTPVDAKPRLTALSTGADGYVSNAVNCKQTIQVPALELALADPVGFFGPYANANSAACATVALARAMTETGTRQEIGIVVLTAKANNDYYLSSFVAGTKSWKEILIGDPFTVSLEDYNRAMHEASDVSCKSPWSAPVYAAGTVHTHPFAFSNGTSFSDTDIQNTQDLRKRSDAANSGFERNFLVGTDHRVYSFDGRGDQQRVVACPLR